MRSNQQAQATKRPAFQLPIQMAAVSTFVGAPLVVKAAPAKARRSALSVQASSAGPKKARAALPPRRPHTRRARCGCRGFRPGAPRRLGPAGPDASSG